MKKSLDPLIKAIGTIKLPSKDASLGHDKYLYGWDKKLIKKVTKDNIHSKVDLGPSVGRKIF